MPISLCCSRLCHRCAGLEETREFAILFQNNERRAYEWQQSTAIRLWNKNHFPRKIYRVPIISVLSTESGRRHRSPQSSAIVLRTLKSAAVKETLCNRKVIHPRSVVFKCYVNSLTQQIQKFSRLHFFPRVLTTSKCRLHNCVSKFLLWYII